CSDRWSGYNWLPIEQRALCWAHLVREFRRMSERPGESAEIGEALMEHGYQVFWDWRRYQAGEIQRCTFKQYMRGLRRQVHLLLKQGANYATEKGPKSARAQTASTCRALLKVESALWTFERKEIEPSNNRAERAIRPLVVLRKVCYGTQSEQGSRLIERLFSVVRSCRQQNRSVLAFMKQSIEAHLGVGTMPSLVSEGLR
ncbi:MAG: transposase, partial [Candidatus Sericytochromatia bacterium]|nr:transposase [Candidatus Sericytochromatia bacterium]